MSIAFDHNPIIYWLAGYLLAFALCVLIYFSTVTKSASFKKYYLVFASVLLVMMRLPVIFFNRELNADESQMLTQAMTLFKDPVYWRSVDGTTGGPLGSYFLILPSLLLGTFDYISAHTGSLLLVFITLAGTFFALKNWFGSIVAMTATYPLVLFFAFTQQADFVHYSSEHVPLAFMGIIMLLLSKTLKGASGNLFRPVILGSLIALLPFGKLQTLPMVAILLIWAIYIFWERQKLVTEGLAFIAGGIGTLALIGLWLFLNQVFEDFTTYYIVGNFQYGGEISWIDNILELPGGLLQSPAVIWFFVPQLVLVAAFFFTKKRSPMPSAHLLFFPLLWVLFTLLAISRTGSGYLHYWLFALIPVSLLFANFLAAFQKQKFLFTAFCVLSLSCVVLPKALQVLRKEPVNLYLSDREHNRDLPFTNIAKSTLKYGKQGDYLAVWGWNCQFYIETQMPQGVAENHTIRSIFKHPMQDVYLKRYLDNVIRNNPVVIIDAVGRNSLWIQDKSSQSLENYPTLYSYISANYKLAETIDDARLYVRKDRLNSR